MNTKRELSKQDLIIFAAILVLLAAMYFSYQIYQDAQESLALADSIRSEIDVKSAELTRVKVLDINKEEFEAELEEKSAMFGNGPEEDLIMEELQYIAEENKCELLSISFGEIADNSSYKQMNMTVSLSGTYTELAEMLMTIHENGRYFRVTNMVFSTSESDEITMNIGLVSFYL